MNRSSYFNYVEHKLSTLVTRIEIRGKLNILDFHLHSENFYANFFNLLFNWELKNLNAIKQNVEAIDLIDDKNKIIIQVSATATKEKIESTLSKDILKGHGDFCFKFVSISKDVKELRKKDFKNPHGIKFSSDDIYDVCSILKIILSLRIEEQKQIYEFIKKELGSEPEHRTIETNLATIINFLSKENLTQETQSEPCIRYEIEQKIAFNNLSDAKSIIEDYGIYYGVLDRIYSEFDKNGVNKSFSVLMSIRSIYSECKNKILDADTIFLNIIDGVVKKIENSSNYEVIPYDELELCVNILVVDAFIRCKIFKKPANHVTT